MANTTTNFASSSTSTLSSSSAAAAAAEGSSSTTPIIGIHVINFSDVSSSSSPLHPLNRRLREHILQQLHHAIVTPKIQAVVLYGGNGGGNGNFSAGADLTELQQFDSAATSIMDDEGPTLIDVVDAIEASPKPVVAAISGACLGGGLEVALACHYRIVAAATATAKLGLPEVHVGVIPGAGGTQRLPRLVGLPTALPMILTGQTVTAQKALQIGLVDAIVDVAVDVETNTTTTNAATADNNAAKDVLLETAQKWASWAAVMPLEDRRVSRRPLRESPAEAHVLLHTASLQLPPPEHGGEGVHAALEAIRAAYDTSLSFDQGMQMEGQLFLKVLTSAQGQARRHAFFAVRQAQKKIPTSTKIPVEHALLQRNNNNNDVQVAVIGAGTMGSGIALVLLQAGFQVWLVDVSRSALDKGLALLQQTIKSYVQRGKWTQDRAQKVLQSKLKSTQNLQDLSDCQLVVEAVIENLKVKQNIFRQLNAIVPSTALLVSNTSTLDIDQIMSSCTTASHHHHVAGWHFFSPAPVMKLVEIVVAKSTSDETVLILQALTKRIGKIGVVVGNCDGFCGNRMLKPYSAEMVLLLVEDGINGTCASTIQDIDKALLDFGMALGPFQMADLAGNDVAYNIRRERGWVRDNKSDPIPVNRPARYTELADDMVSQLGRNGQKVGKGWYNYNPAIGKGRKGLPSDEMADLIQSYKTTRAETTTVSSRRPLSDSEIIERVLFPLVNEGFKCLEEGIARCPSDIDVVYLYGYGFPAWRGGPMYWADNEVGLPNLLQKLQDFHRQFPETEHYVPSTLLERCVELDVTVKDYYRRGMHNNTTLSDPRSRL